MKHLNAALIALVALTIAWQSVLFAQPANGLVVAFPQSAYVKRMMSLDRNRDGFLEARELPGTLSQLIGQHDADSDGRLSPQELSSLEDKAMAVRESQNPAATGDPGKAKGRSGRGPAAGRSQGKASPLDAKQILRFALTFDHNGDGGLSADELRRYTVALAARRAAHRASRVPTDGASPASDRSPSQQSAAPAKGLSADGKGNGGFGDPP